MARPVAVVAVPSGQSTILLVMDVSRSMCSTDIEPSRLAAAEAAAAEFIEQQARATLIGIVAFSGFAELIQAPTNDTGVLLDARLHSLLTGRARRWAAASSPPSTPSPRSTRAWRPPVTAFTTGVAPAPVVPGAYAPAIIVVLTDGASNAGVGAGGRRPAGGRSRAACLHHRLRHGGRRAGRAACGPSLPGSRATDGGTGNGGGGFGGGVGPGGFRRGIDEDTLRTVAQITGGEYYPAESASELHSVFMGLPTSIITAHEVVELSVAFAGAGALLTLLALGLSQRWRPLP